MDFLTKIILHFKKIKIIIISGEGKTLAGKSIQQVLGAHFKIKNFIEKNPNIFDILTNDILLFETGLGNSKIFENTVSLAKASQLPILVITHFGKIPNESEFFSGEEEKTNQIRKLAQLIPPYGFLILNFDDKAVKKIDDITNLKSFTFGFGEKSDFRASDVHVNGDMNFKINYKGKIIPIWQEKVSGKEYVYSALAASCVAIVLGLNFVEISEALKRCKAYSDKIK